jgi:hypothetical protein
MANLSNYNYNVGTINSGTGPDGKTPFFTYVVDPNPTDNVLVNPEDLFIFVRLRSFPQNRSVITSDNVYSSKSREADSISFIATSSENEADGKTGYLTTNYTNIGLNETTHEGLGITRISIETAMMTPPKVEIDFVDVKGSAVFNNYEYFDGEGVENISKYNSFFRLPYPIYELTVKGYYGRPTTYYLNMIDFKASFDEGSSDFIINCKFLGYQFSFLSDVITKYVMALNATNAGKDYLKNYIKKDGSIGLSSITELLIKYTEIANYTEKFKQKDTDYSQLTIINTLQIKADEITEIINSPSKLITNPTGLNLNYEQFKTGEGYYFFRDIGLFSDKLIPNLDEMQNNVNSLINEYNSLINLNKGKYPDLNNYFLNNFTLSKSISYNDVNDALLQIIDTEIISNENTSYLSNYQSSITFIQSKFDSFTPVSFYSFYSVRDNVHEKRKLLKNKKTELEEKIVDQLNGAFTTDIGFNPTVYNVFEIIFGNVDVFLNILYETCRKAESIGDIRIQGLKDYYSIQSNLSGGSTDIPISENKIYPFPAVFDTNGERIWLGDVVGNNNPNFPELEIVNDIIKGLTSNELFDIPDNPYSFSPTAIYKWIPINILDYRENGLSLSQNFDYGDATLSELYKEILKRLRILYSYSIFDPFNGENYVISYSEIEASYFIDQIENDKILKFINTLDPATFVNNGLAYNFTNDDVTIAPYQFNDNNTGLVFSPISFIDNSNLQYLAGDRASYTSKALSPALNTYFADTKTIQAFIFRNLINPDYFIFDQNYFNVTADLTNVFNNDDLNKYLKNISSGSAASISSMYNLNVIDGTAAGIVGADTTSGNVSGDRANNSRYKIGRSITQYKQFVKIFDLFYYDKNNINAKAFLFLETIGYKDYYHFREYANKFSCVLNMTELYVAYIGGILKHSHQIHYQGYNFLVDDIKSDPEYTNVGDYNARYNRTWVPKSEFENLLSDEGFKFFVDAFDKFVEEYNAGGFSNYVYNYVTFDPKSDNTIGEYETAFDTILNRIKAYKEVAIISPRELFKQPIIEPNSNVISKYLSGFINAAKKFINTKLTEKQRIRQDEINNIITDKNIKIQIYEHLKNIYDKWLSYSTVDGKIYNFANYFVNGNTDTKKKLIDHCYFIDRTWSYIGDKAVLNPKPLLIYANQTDGNIYFLMSRVLKDNNFNIYNIPSFVNYYDKQDVMEMFKPFTTLNENVNFSDDKPTGGSCFVFQYVAGNSKVLDLNNRVGYFNDSFDFNANAIIDTNLPKSILNRNISQTQLTGADLKDYLAKYNLSVFRVAYADQNQNIFKRIEVSQQEHRETAESILILNELAGGKGATKRLYTGMDLYNVYAVRSYSTTVECLGNTQILPTQYFQLDNVPLFHGAHMITSVKHEITPNNMTTTFSGMRISKFTYPIIDKMTTFLNLELSNSISSSELTVPLSNESDFSNGEDRGTVNTNSKNIDSTILREIQQTGAGSANTALNSQNTLFTIEYRGAVAKFSVSTSVNTAVLNTELSNLFTSNNVSTFGLGNNVCATWARTALEQLGVVRIGAVDKIGDAWNWFMGLPEDGRMGYFTANDKLNNWSNSDLVAKGIPNGSLLFGYSQGSSFKTKAYNQMNDPVNFPNRTSRKNIMRTNNRSPMNSNFDFSVVTHVGIFYNNQFYNLVSSRVKQEPDSGFVPIAFYPFLDKLRNIVANN